MSAFDPVLFRALRDQVIPGLHTWPSARVWVVDGAIGANALAVLVALAEARLLARVRVYATHPDEAVVAELAGGKLGCDAASARAAYRDGGGTLGLDEHCRFDKGGALLRPDLQRRLSCFVHDVGSGASLNEFQLIVSGEGARPAAEGARFFQLCHESLCRFGVLALAEGDSLVLHPWGKAYESLTDGERFWRRKR